MLSVAEGMRARFGRPDPVVPKWPTPGAMAVALDAKTRQTPALRLIDDALVDLLAEPDGRLIISLPPQEGKSQRTSRRFPLWALTQNPDLRIAITSYEHGVARRWGRAIRDDITQHSEDLGLRVRDDLSAQHEWQLAGHEGGVYAAGIGGALTGRPVDLLIIDDPVKDRAQADSPTIRGNAWDWWTDVASTRLAPGAQAVLILTRWHHDDLAGRLQQAEDGHRWRVINVPAEAHSEDDPLGRAPGEFLQSARGRSREDWERIKVQAGPRTWASLYQGNPTPDTGGIFPTDWPRYNTPIWDDTDGNRVTLGNITRVIQSWDLTFKDGAGTDYVVGQVWGQAGQTLYLLDQVRRRMDFTRTLQVIRDLYHRWPETTAVLVEDKANGPAVINTLRAEIPGIIPVEPDGGKVARAVAVQPYTAAGNVILPDSTLLPSVADLTHEAAEFPAGQHDDTVDALTQAVNWLYRINPATGTVVTADDLYDLHDVTLGTY